MKFELGETVGIRFGYRYLEATIIINPRYQRMLRVYVKNYGVFDVSRRNIHKLKGGEK